VSDELFGAPAGWYPDPLGLPQLRWWNNHAWTEQTSAARQPMVVQDTKFAWADEELPSRREERERERRNNTPAPTADALRELEPPLAAAQIGQQPPAEAFVEGSPAFVETDFAAETPAAEAESAEPKWWSAATTTSEPTRKAAAAARQAAAAAAAQAAAAAAAPAEPVFTDDPFRQYTAAPSFGSLFDTAAPVTVTSSTGESLESIFGTPQTRRSAMGRTPLVTPPAADEQPAGTAPARKLIANTGPGWIIAMVPLFQLVVGLLVVTSLGQAVQPWMLLAIFFVPLAAAVGLAYLDYNALKNGGMAKPAHWAFAVLSVPVYLVLRARATLRESGHGVGPILVFAGLVVLLFASVVAVPGLAIATVPGVFADQIEQSVSGQALIFGSNLSVSCDPTPPVLPGEEIICATQNGDISSTATVELVRANGWIAWTVTDWGSYAG